MTCRRSVDTIEGGARGCGSDERTETASASLEDKAGQTLAAKVPHNSEENSHSKNK